MVRSVSRTQKYVDNMSIEEIIPATQKTTGPILAVTAWTEPEITNNGAADCSAPLTRSRLVYDRRAAPVLRPRRFRMAESVGAFLAVADRRDPPRFDAERHQEILH